MKLQFKLLVYNFAYAILAIIIVPVILVLLLMFLWDVPSCDEDSEAVAYARSLSPQRLEKLFRDMEMHSVREDLPIGGYQVQRNRDQIPDEFADLKVVKIRPAEGNIMIEGCFDHYIS
ncbi:MAG: hypothetical protein KZQ93_06980 [Candidatus Thiodiazotropha sp. (ex Monitilora ramsayi)]|nr:hypothetical protein [Candidatus Thiodiazotropha sp. (ex Monitilora ramsayi)]